MRLGYPVTFASYSGSASERAGGRTGGGSGRVPLGAEFGLDSITPARLPGLRVVRDSVRAAAGDRRLSLLEQAEADVITEVLAASGGNKAAAARRLGLSRPTLYAKLRAYRI